MSWMTPHLGVEPGFARLSIECRTSIAGAGPVCIWCCGAGADLDWGTNGFYTRDMSGGGFGGSDGDLSGGDTAVSDVAGRIVPGQVSATAGAVADLDPGAGAVIAIETRRENRVRSDLKRSGPRRVGHCERVVDDGSAILLDEEGVRIVGCVGDGNRGARFSIGIGSNADGSGIRRGQEDIASVIAELLAKGGRKRVVVASGGMR